MTDRCLKGTGGCLKGTGGCLKGTDGCLEALPGLWFGWYGWSSTWLLVSGPVGGRGLVDGGHSDALKDFLTGKFIGVTCLRGRVTAVL